MLHGDAAINAYIEKLKTYNQITNIYSESAYDHLPYHIENSLKILEVAPNHTLSILDIGSGSGLPVIPLAIAAPHIQITAVESKSRKTKFLSGVKETLELHNLTVVTANIHEYVAKSRPRPSVITAKAFAPLVRLLPLLKTLAYTHAQVIIPISERQADALASQEWPSHIRQHSIVHREDHHYLVMILI
jgi:16S rRNA (guanine527-N7)-methyltransferase